MGKWKSENTLQYDEEEVKASLNLFAFHSNSNVKIRLNNSLGMIISTSYKPTGTEAEPSNNAIRLASDTVQRDILAYASLFNNNSADKSEEFQSLDEKEKAVLYESRYGTSMSVSKVLGSLLGQQIENSTQRVQDAEEARDLFNALSKFATKANLEGFTTAFKGTMAYDREHSRAIVNKLVREGKMPEELGKNIDATINTDQKAWLFMEWHDRTDYATAIENETAPLNILQVMKEEEVMKEVLATVLPQVVGN
ncbi:hypothetical protein ASPBRDRAFT_69295 [Aspergillus brasiliensis CBS 101740]|uniref:Uncharacterized protein n=1 Tax=Aspergillus brasiliensis (strain CBS 101740 / IMI 381727 / IBT 21946) TaxID=767769 RepID=A0A1L9U6E1_ASPBC|nr:hypothetical protein ASPBRDRAFT_69295 [Aspergillus brasiliensis CBS 101740]